MWDTQGLILSPLLLSIFINVMFFSVSESRICNFADDNTLSSCDKMLGDILDNLEFGFGHILKLFKVNTLKPNPGKFQFMMLGKHTDIKLETYYCMETKLKTSVGCPT